MRRNLNKYDSCAVVVCPMCGRSIHIHHAGGETRYNVHLMQQGIIVERESTMGCGNAKMNLSNANCFMSGRSINP